MELSCVYFLLVLLKGGFNVLQEATAVLETVWCILVANDRNDAMVKKLAEADVTIVGLSFLVVNIK
jgi:hypothetical protein